MQRASRPLAARPCGEGEVDDEALADDDGNHNRGDASASSALLQDKYSLQSQSQR